MTVLTADLLASFDASVTDVATAETMPPAIYTSEEFLAFERARRVRPRVAVRRRGEPDPERRRLLHDDGQRRADHRRPGQGRLGPRLLGDLPAPRDAGRRRRRQLHQVHVPVPPLELRPHRPAARRAGDGAHRRLRQEGLPAAGAAGRAVAGLRVRPLRPRRRAAGADARRLRAVRRALRPRARRLPGHVHPRRPAVELEGDVRELQRRLPRQQAAPHDPGLLPERAGRVPREWTEGSNVIFRTNGYTHIDGGFNATTKALLPIFPDLTEEERWRSTFALLPPTLCFGTAPDQAFFFIVRPKTADTIDLEIGYLLHPSAPKHPMFEHLMAMSDAGVQVFVRQDQDATTKVQRGMHSRFAARGRYSWQEESHVQFNRWLVQRYRQHWPIVDELREVNGFSAGTHRTSSLTSTAGHPAPHHTHSPGGEPMKRLTTTIAALAALSLLAAACGDDDDGGAAATTAGGRRGHRPRPTPRPRRPARRPAPRQTIPATDATTEGSGAGEAIDLDTNGDGKVVIGVATPGPRNDGAYYQALVDGVTTFSTENGYEDPIIVDNIKPEEAATQLDGLARQNVDMIAVGAGEIADPLPDLTAKYGDIIWYCNCGGGFQELPNLIQSGDDGSEIGYSAGVRHRPADEGQGRHQGGDDRQQQLQLREGVVRRLPPRPRPGRPVVRVDVRRDRLVQRRRRGDRGVQQPQGAGRRGHLPVPRRLPRGGRQAVERERRHHDERRRRQRLRADRPRLPDRRQVRRRPVRGHDPRRDPVGRAAARRDPRVPRRRRRQRRRGHLQADAGAGDRRWRTCWRRSPPATSRPSSTRTARRRTPLERSVGTRRAGRRRRPTSPLDRSAPTTRRRRPPRRHHQALRPRRGVRRRRPRRSSGGASTACSARTAPASRR